MPPLRRDRERDPAARGHPDGRAGEGAARSGAFLRWRSQPRHPHPLARVLALPRSGAASWLSGQVFEVTGTEVRRWLPWSPGASVSSGDGPWTVDALDSALATMVYGTLPGG